MAFFIEYNKRKKSKYCYNPPTLPPPPHFLSPSFKTFVTHHRKINNLDTAVTVPKIWDVHWPLFRVPDSYISGRLSSHSMNQNATFFRVLEFADLRITTKLGNKRLWRITFCTQSLSLLQYTQHLGKDILKVSWFCFFCLSNWSHKSLD